MAQRTAVPKFGNWENGENVPYTVCFEKARKGRTRGKINSVESQQQIEPHFSPEDTNSSRRSQHSPLQTNDAIGQNILRAKQSQRGPPDSPIKLAADSPARHYGGLSSGRGVRRSGNSDASIEQPASHLSKDRSKGNGIGQVPMTPGRSRLRSADGSAVPKFGEWDENNPESGDGYTLIFNRVKQDRHGASVKSPSSNLSNQTSNSSAQPRKPNSKSIGCFCWG